MLDNALRVIINPLKPSGAKLHRILHFGKTGNIALQTTTGECVILSVISIREAREMQKNEGVVSKPFQLSSIDEV